MHHMNGAIDATIAVVIFTTSVITGAIEYAQSTAAQGDLEWIGRLLPEVAILIVAGYGARWIIKMFLDQLNTIQERSDKRADRMEQPTHSGPRPDDRQHADHDRHSAPDRAQDGR